MISSSSDSISTSPSEQCLRRILFPMRRSETKHSDDKSRFTSTDDKSKPRGTTTTGPNLRNENSMEWVGLTPLEMVEKLASMTEKSMVLSRRLMKPLRVETSFLATESPELPPPPPAVRRQFRKNDIDSRIPIFVLSPANSSEDKSLEEGRLSGQKRRRTESDVDSAEERGDDPNIETNQAASCLPPWDPSYIMIRDPNSDSARDAAVRLTSLATQLESLPSYEHFLPSYMRIRDYLAITFGRIHQQEGARQDTTKRILLDELYEDVVQRMTTLLQMAEELDLDDVTMTSFTDSKPDVTNSSRVEHQRARLADKQRKECSKKDFAEYMNHWLKDNWENPFPDDEGLADMARVCGTNPTIVNNWLINNRTRKWRPAIVRAYEMGRPADCLKEDAIRIFEERPLRPVVAVGVGVGGRISMANTSSLCAKRVTK